VTARVDLAALEAAYADWDEIGLTVTRYQECVAALPALIAIARAAERLEAAKQGWRRALHSAGTSTRTRTEAGELKAAWAELSEALSGEQP
jgi:hypothetical protein